MRYITPYICFILLLAVLCSSINQEKNSEPRPLFSLLSVEMKRYLAINFSLYKLLPFCLVFFIQLSIQAQTPIEIPTDSNWARTLIDELEMMPDQMQTIDGGCTSPGHASGSKLYPDSDVVGYCANVQVAMHPSKK